MVNYRKLPYGLGMGIRMGTSAATLQGIDSHNIAELASIMAEIYNTKRADSQLVERTQSFLSKLMPLTHMKEETR